MKHLRYVGEAPGKCLILIKAQISVIEAKNLPTDCL